MNMMVPSMICITIAAVQLFAVAMATQQSVSAIYQWQQLQWGCIHESKAKMQQKADNLIDCTTIASRAAAADSVGDAVAQWNSHTHMCCVFEFHDVCGLASSTASSSAQCQLYRRESARTNFAQSLSKKFTAAWLFGSDQNTHSVVCSDADPNTNRFHSVTISWNNEGAVFNGVNSQMIMNSSKYLNFSSGFTWLMRVKRQPKVQEFMGMFSCSVSTNRGAHFFEWSSPNMMLFNTYGTMPTLGYLHSVDNLLPNDASTWLNIGATGKPGINTVWLFFANSLLTEDQSVRSTWSAKTLTDPCIALGLSPHDNRVLQGTVRAVGIANISMTEQEITEFFSQIP